MLFVCIRERMPVKGFGSAIHTDRPEMLLIEVFFEAKWRGILESVLFLLEFRDY